MLAIDDNSIEFTEYNTFALIEYFAKGFNYYNAKKVFHCLTAAFDLELLIERPREKSDFRAKGFLCNFYTNLLAVLFTTRFLPTLKGLKVSKDDHEKAFSFFRAFGKDSRWNKVQPGDIPHSPLKTLRHHVPKRVKKTIKELFPSFTEISFMLDEMVTLPGSPKDTELPRDTEDT